MGLQTNVAKYPVAGLAGQQVAFGQADYTEVNYLSDGTVKAGAFAFVGTATVNISGADMPIASLTGTQLLGFVERVQTGVVLPTSDATVVYLAGEGLTIAKNGEYYADATGAATVGQHVCVNKTTGAMTYINAGDTPATGTVDTGWVVKTAAAAAGDLIIIAAHANA